MSSICGSDCCAACERREECGGCERAGGHPFGGTCIAAERVKRSGPDGLQRAKQALIAEINALGIENLALNDLHLLLGGYINLEYPLPNGQTVKFLRDNDVYWGNRAEIPGSDACYNVAAGDLFLLVCKTGPAGVPEIIVYKKR
ncbi:MAG TPA: hypothetical protein H9731_06735 [Candidatus Borkfalkia excrementipullorum]|nr:hypothetical protein [Candidatus Borkfalkia excrementipullorum]